MSVATAMPGPVLGMRHRTVRVNIGRERAVPSWKWKCSANSHDRAIETNQQVPALAGSCPKAITCNI